MNADKAHCMRVRFRLFGAVKIRNRYSHRLSLSVFNYFCSVSCFLANAMIQASIRVRLLELEMQFYGITVNFIFVLVIC